MKRLLIASVCSLLASAPAMANPVESGWWVVNQAKSVCMRPPFTPRQFDAYLREQGQLPVTKTYKNDDGTLIGVEISYQINGKTAFTAFYVSMYKCQDEVNSEVASGELLPPDMK